MPCNSKQQIIKNIWFLSGYIDCFSMVFDIDMVFEKKEFGVKFNV